MKKFLTGLAAIAVYLLVNISFGISQTVQWAKQGSSEGFDNGNGIVVDESGNSYVTGQIEFTAVFDSYTLSSYGIHDILVAKYNTNGQIDWIHSAGGTGGDVGNAIGIDGSHNTYVAGEIETTANFGSGITVSSSGSNDIFLAKYDNNGQISWVKRWGSSSNDKALGIAVNSAGDCYITGYYSGNTNFGGTNLNHSGSNDAFVVKTNSSGTVQWAKKIGGSREDRGVGIALDPSGNVYVTGSFSQSTSVSGTTLTNSGKQSSFLAKYNSSGALQWARAGGACCDTTKAEGVTTDENGNIYVVGHYSATTKFGTNQFNSTGGYDAFIVKYDPSGNVVWAKHGGGTDEDIAYSATVDPINHILYVTGSLESTSGSFDSRGFSIVGYKDVFLAAYDMSGNCLWLKTYGGHHRDVGSSIAVDNLGYIYTTGIYNGESYFDSFTLHGYPNQPWADFLTYKTSAEPVSSPNNQSTNLSASPGHCSDLDVTFVPGDGSRRIVVVRQGSAVNSDPLDGVIYSANTTFGNGSNLGSNCYVVYDGTGNSVSVTGLTPGSTYYFAVYEYNGIGANINYRTSSPPSANAVAATFTINIAGLHSAICLGDSLILQASGSSTYSWFPLTGLSTGSGPNVIAKPNATIDYTVTATNSSGCQAIRNFTVTVNPLPDVHFPNLGTFCSDDSPVTLNGGTPTGGTYSGPGVGAGQFDPSVAGAGSFTLQYLYTDGNGCSDVNPSTVDVNPAATATISVLPSVCENSPSFALTGGSPAGGTYSGAGVSSGTFDPSVGQGVYTVSYSVTNSFGCEATTSVFQVVSPLPSIDLGSDLVVCASHTIPIDAGSGYSTYHWSDGSTGQTINVDSSGTGLGTKTVILEVSAATGCVNSDTLLIRFDLCAGISNPVDIDFANVYPNPFQKEFTLMTDKIVSFKIYDICGQVVYESENAFGKISAGENLSPGVYFVEIKSGIARKTIPVLKAN